MNWENPFEKITAIVISIGGLLAGIWVAWEHWEKIWNNMLKPLWNRVLGPFLKFVLGFLTLILPNGFIIGFLLYRVASYYWVVNSVESIIANQMVFLQLVALQTILVSLYSFFWFSLLYPRIQPWLFSQKNNSQHHQQSPDIL